MCTLAIVAPLYLCILSLGFCNLPLSICVFTFYKYNTCICYNHVPDFVGYRSNNKSLVIEVLTQAISQNRSQLLHSKLYFRNPRKPDNSFKTNYIKELI